MFCSFLTGGVDLLTVNRWKENMDQEALAIPRGMHFRSLFSLEGYQPLDVEVHKAMRQTIPYFLSRFNFYAGYLRLFPEVRVPLKSTGGSQCDRVAHVHNDQGKMQEYQRRFGRDNEQFFTTNRAAFDWILQPDHGTTELRGDSSLHEKLFNSIFGEG